MDNASLIKYANGRFKVYTYHKLNLKVDMSKEEFDDCVNELFDDIEKDTQMLLDFENNGEVVPKPVVSAFASLSQYSDRVLEFYSIFKTLKGF